MTDNKDAGSALAAHVSLMEERISDLEAVVRQALSWYEAYETNMPPRWVNNARLLVKEQELEDGTEDTDSRGPD